VDFEFHIEPFPFAPATVFQLVFLKFVVKVLEKLSVFWRYERKIFRLILRWQGRSKAWDIQIREMEGGFGRRRR
jgi:hypothetical protein